LIEVNHCTLDCASDIGRFPKEPELLRDVEAAARAHPVQNLMLRRELRQSNRLILD
jgi:hypothetical protein